MNGTTNPANGARPSDQQRTLQSEIALLQSILSQNGPEDAEANVAELLRRLETADGIATGVESRLDEIIGNLDNLIGTLEPGAQLETITVDQGTAIVQQGERVVQEGHVGAVLKQRVIEGQEDTADDKA
ncbi:uncharacterized protein FIBRA_00900 [Fibroporia radiculosa]|uniref:Uncharacterized protein n=1 Tax=Fibroporia radiculosa TaxID=599839 RepID=J4G0N9_9APHY|nr:uncharacterized protein FIBRA_00900 [Fibroporia radiculosa]CCL98893.1 predicted protein [Fibroporia radiculosa]